MGIVISAFPGSGKTVATEELAQAGLRVRDYDSDAFPATEERPAIKHKHLVKALEENDIVFINTDVWTRKNLLEAGVKVVIFYPAHEIKFGWLSRIYNRKTGVSGENFTRNISEAWAQWIAEIESDKASPYGELIELHKLDEKTPFMKPDTVLGIFNRRMSG